jgi:formyltetrahydrofolate deformylase
VARIPLTIRNDVGVNPTDHVLLLSCPDRPGIVASVTTLLAEHGANIEDSQQYKDPGTGRFFMRIHFRDAAGRGLDVGAIDNPATDWATVLAPVGTAYDMDWEVRPTAKRTRTLLMVSKFGHCLNDLLFRWQSGSLDIDVVGVVSNHEDLRQLVEAHGVPFHHIPVTPEAKADAEARMLALIDEQEVDLVVLARYMQILSDGVSRRLSGRVINIHHSFLPSFKGAKPYHQAYDRGVKIVGATAHYVTADLDEGPIIEQDVHRVDHRMTPEALVRAGEEVESRVLAKAVRWHAEHRVVLNGQRTVVFS